jgi:hypothetical protein
MKFSLYNSFGAKCRQQLTEPVEKHHRALLPPTTTSNITLPVRKQTDTHNHILVMKCPPAGDKVSKEDGYTYLRSLRVML